MIATATSCVTLGKVLVDEGDTKTIGVRTGTILDDDAYIKAFHNASVDACPEGYSIEYTGRDPETIPPNLREKYSFYWIIKCKTP